MVVKETMKPNMCTLPLIKAVKPACGGWGLSDIYGVNRAVGTHVHIGGICGSKTKRINRAVNYIGVLMAFMVAVQVVLLGKQMACKIYTLGFWQWEFQIHR